MDFKGFLARRKGTYLGNGVTSLKENENNVW
jgi:hypothetical protein